jgi:hypothetical protein
MPIGAIKRVLPSLITYKIPFIASIDTCTFLGPEPDYFFLADTVNMRSARRQRRFHACVRGTAKDE